MKNKNGIFFVGSFVCAFLVDFLFDKWI